MRIDYCPKCGKAGLKYETPEGRDCTGRTNEERYQDFVNDILPTPCIKNKWCPRCKEWIKPENRPYIGVKDRT